MEIVEPADDPKPHKWLKWVGLAEPPATADSWVPVVRGLGLSDLQTHTSAAGARLVELLGAAGIEAQQRSYEFEQPYVRGVGSISGLTGVGGQMVPRVAVLVHNRDRSRAIEVARELNRTLERAQVMPDAGDEGPAPRRQ